MALLSDRADRPDHLLGYRLRGGGFLSHLPQAVALGDGAIFLTFSLALELLKEGRGWGNVVDLGGPSKFSLAAAGLFTVSAIGRGVYHRTQLRCLTAQAKELAIACIMAIASLAAISLFLGLDALLILTRAFPAFAVSLAAVLLFRCSIRKALAHATVAPRRRKRGAVLIRQAAPTLNGSVLDAIESYGPEVRDTIVLPPTTAGAEYSRCVAEVIEYIRTHTVDEVLLALTWTDTAFVERLVDQLRVVPVSITLIQDHVVGNLLERPLVEFGPVRGVQLQRVPLSTGQRVLKRLLDLAVSVVVLALLSPLLAGVAALIALESSGPVLFKQRRMGFNGRIFQIYKFRTMTVLEDGQVIRQAQADDERLTRVGGILRRFSIDELPQFINVLKGDMSVVGPRPHALAHDTEYGEMIRWYTARHNVKPGITGWAQVNDLRGPTPDIHLMANRVSHDLWYINNWSLWLDLKILLLTPARIYTTKNAY
jgi:Undecaprenyl-phosphate glucose phosphotransferase